MYPYICTCGKFPVDHPEVSVGADCPRDCSDRVGIIKCNVVHPMNLYYPVLSYKSNTRLMFPLYSACADTMGEGNCTHDKVR